MGKAPVDRNALYYFYQNLFLLVVLTCWNRNTFQILIKFHLKRRKLILKPFPPLHWMCYIAQQWFIYTTLNLSFRIYFYIATRRSQKIIIFCSLSSRGLNTLPGACTDQHLYRDGHITRYSSMLNRILLVIVM